MFTSERQHSSIANHFTTSTTKCSAKAVSVIGLST